MKKGIIIIAAMLLFVCTSCSKLFDSGKTLFYVTNDCNRSIKVVFKWTEFSFSGIEYKTQNIVLSSGTTHFLRAYKVDEDFSMTSVFTDIEVFRDYEASYTDAFDKSFWVKTLSDDDRDEYTLHVDETFFDDYSEN